MFLFTGKTGYLVIALILAIILLIILQIIAGGTKQSGQIEQTTNTVPQASLPPDTFYIERHTLSNQPLGVAASFSIIFSQPIDIDRLQYNIDPSIEIELSLDTTGKVLTVVPEGTWGFDTAYKLVIEKGTTSNAGKQLNSEGVIYFRTAPYAGI